MDNPITMKRRNVRTLSLIVVTFTYLLIGAAVFDALEGPNNIKVFDALTEIKSNFVKKYNVTPDDFRIMEVLVIEKKPHKAGPQWKFAGSFYYALVVLALIGYGHSTPATNLGKAFTMGYAMAGIPMAMVMFQSMGERMNKAYSVCIKKLRTWFECPRRDATEVDLIIASGITSSIVVWSGAILYHTQEGWDFFDSLYYSFITLSTIGFGDFVALQQEDKALHFRPGYVICSFIFLLVGLAALSSSINLLVLRFMILSLEEEEQDQMADMSQNVVTLDEIMAVNGRVLNIETFNSSERNLTQLPMTDPDSVSVCSCTCYGGRSSSRGRTTRGRGRGRRRRERGLAQRVCLCLGKTFGCGEELDNNSDNFYDEETQSISNYARLAVKRASF